MKRFTVLLAVIVLVLLVVAVAFAAPPEKNYFDFDYTYPMVHCGDSPPFYVGVGDFWIWNNEVGTGSYTEYFDKDGKLVSTLEDAETAVNIMFDAIVIKTDDLNEKQRKYLSVRGI